MGVCGVQASSTSQNNLHKVLIVLRGGVCLARALCTTLGECLPGARPARYF